MKGYGKEKIIRVLLNNAKGLTKYRVSKDSGCSFSWTHEFLKRLEKEGYIKKTQVLDYKKLLGLWISLRKASSHKDYFLQDPLKFVKRAGMKYALTTYQAENLTQGYLFPARTDVYVRKEDLESWHEKISKAGMVGKGNTRLLVEDEHVFYNSFQVSGYSLVSEPQLVLDLMIEGGPCKEAADLLLKKHV